MYLSEEVGETAKAARQLAKMHTDSKSEKFELAHNGGCAELFIGYCKQVRYRLGEGFLGKRRDK